MAERELICCTCIIWHHHYLACPLAICFQFLDKEWPSMHAWGSLHVGRGPLFVWSVSCMQSSFLSLSFRPHHDPWLLHGPWFLVLVTLALWSSALGPWLCPCMHCPWFPPAQGPWALLLDSWSLALGPVSQFGRWGRKRAAIYTLNLHAFRFVNSEISAMTH